MKRKVLLAVLGIVIVIGMNACASNKAVTLNDDFWDDTRPVVGVVLASLPEPEVTAKIFSSAPFGRTRTLIMSSRYDQDFDGEPYILRDQRELWHYLNSHEVSALAGMKDIFAQGLASRGFRTVTIDENIDPEELPRYTPPASGHARKDYQGIGLSRGVDLLIILDVDKYGTYCGYLSDHGIFTHVRVALTGEMVEIRTNRVLWRFTYRTAMDRESASSRCDDPATYPQIIEDLGNTLVEAAGHIADDFFSGASR